MEKKVYKLFQPKEFIENKKEITEFSNEMYKNGYVYVECPDEMKQTYENLIKISKKFFDLSLEEKKKFSSHPNRETTTKNFENKEHIEKKQEIKEVKIEKQEIKEDKRKLLQIRDRREFFDVTQHTKMFIDEEFSKLTISSYDLFYKYSLEYLEQLLFPLKCDFEYVKSLLGPSRTTLRLLKYNYVGDELKETCFRHTDMGLVTLAVCLDHGLEMKDFKTHKWVDVEDNAPTKPCLILFCGESLSRLTGGYFKAILHRVFTKSDRYSFPFFFRARDNAILDRLSLKSDVLDLLIESNQVEDLDPITVDDLNRLVLSQYGSRQFAVELGNYKKDKYWDLHFDLNGGE